MPVKNPTGGGGGAVKSVNGRTGEVVLGLDDFNPFYGEAGGIAGLDALGHQTSGTFANGIDVWKPDTEGSPARSVFRVDTVNELALSVYPLITPQIQASALGADADLALNAGGRIKANAPVDFADEVSLAADLTLAPGSSMTAEVVTCAAVDVSPPNPPAGTIVFHRPTKTFQGFDGTDWQPLNNNA